MADCTLGEPCHQPHCTACYPETAIPYYLLVTGSRTWAKPDVIRDAFTEIAERYPHHEITLIHGMCNPWHSPSRAPIGWRDAKKLSWEAQRRLLGADWLAEWEAIELRWRVERRPAGWMTTGRYDPQAGFRRNAEMVEELAKAIADGSPGETLAFIDECAKRSCRQPRPHGSHGATHCAQLAEKAGVDTRRYKP